MCYVYVLHVAFWNIWSVNIILLIFSYINIHLFIHFYCCIILHFDYTPIYLLSFPLIYFFSFFNIYFYKWCCHEHFCMSFHGISVLVSIPIAIILVQATIMFRSCLKFFPVFLSSFNLLSPQDEFKKK